MAQQNYTGIDYRDLEGRQFVPNVGSIVLNLLNGVKHTAESFSKLYGLDIGDLKAVIKGEIAPTPEIIDAVKKHSPLNVRDLYDAPYKEQFPIIDDTKSGVVYFSSQQRKDTERVFKRGPGSPYYRYADTAMSRTSKFRPEWIRELYIHHGEDGNLPDWAFNKGHFEHQMTLFIGSVNFYWIDKDGKKHVQRMNTGDMNYITPFVPHSFATRLDGNGLILAVTYGGAISTEEYQSKIKSSNADEFISRTQSQLPPIGQSLTTDEYKGIIIRRYSDAGLIERQVPRIMMGPMDTLMLVKCQYSLRELMGDVPFQEHTKALEYIVKSGQETNPERTDADRWGYNIGYVPVTLAWDGLEQELEPGSSFFIQPNVEHIFRNESPKDSRIIVMQIRPSSGNPLEELALISRYVGEEGIRRVHSETMQWF